MPKISTYSPASATGKALRSLVLNKQVLVSSAQILDLHNTQVTLVAAPGAGKFIKVMEIVPLLNAGAIQYAGDGPLYARYDGQQTISENFIPTDPTDAVYFVAMILSGGAEAATVDNLAVVLTSDAPMTAGNGTMLVDIMYRTVDLS